MFRVLHDRASNVSPGLLPCACPAGGVGRGLCEIQAGTNKEKGLIMSEGIQLYDTVEAIAAAYGRRKAEIDRAVTVAEECSVELKEDYQTKHKQESWREILDKSGAKQWMTTKQRESVTDKLWNSPKELPEITVEGLRGWLQDLVVASPDMLRDLCKEAFDFLTPQKRVWGNDYKSNENKREIPKSGRVVLCWMCECDKWVTTPRLSYRNGEKLHVLDRVFALLAGRPVPERTESVYGLCETATKAGESEAVTYWGRLKMHKNGNLHIWLTDTALTRKLCEVAAGNNLKAA